MNETKKEKLKKKQSEKYENRKKNDEMMTMKWTKRFSNFQCNRQWIFHIISTRLQCTMVSSVQFKRTKVIGFLSMKWQSQSSSHFDIDRKIISMILWYELHSTIFCVSVAVQKFIFRLYFSAQIEKSDDNCFRFILKMANYFFRFRRFNPFQSRDALRRWRMKYWCRQCRRQTMEEKPIDEDIQFHPSNIYQEKIIYLFQQRVDSSSRNETIDDGIASMSCCGK